MKVITEVTEVYVKKHFVTRCLSMKVLKQIDISMNTYFMFLPSERPLRKVKDLRGIKEI